MKTTEHLTLDQNDRHVINALSAEQALFMRYDFSASSRYIELPGYDIKIRITEVGVGAPLVIVPGNTGDGFPFAPLIARIKKRRIIIVNRPGGGLSEGMDHRRVDMRRLAVDTLTTVFDSLGIEKAPVIAHSFGGHWSLWFAMDCPERVEALALLGVPGNIMGTCPPFALRLTSIPGVNRVLFRAIISKDKAKALKGLLFMGHSRETVDGLGQEMAGCYYHFQNLPHYAISSLSLMERCNRLCGSRPDVRIDREALAEVRNPVLMLWGENDPFASVTKGERIAATIPGARFHVLKNAGHLPWLDYPGECSRLICEFFGIDSDIGCVLF
jgi:pimeloyl-ACP methyl ester carboxylesterase